MEQSVAYLDLLAFSSNVRENTQDALMAFTMYRTILETKIIDNLAHPLESYQDPRLQELAHKNSVNSFNYFLPFSDSIFIASDDPNSFIKQLGAFVLHCFTITSRQYIDPKDKSNPTKVINKRIRADETGKIVTEEFESNWYPTLFRGGIAFGEVIPIELLGIVKNEPTRIANLAGKAVVKAVGLESKVKGPRIIFEKEFYEKLNSETRVYTQEIERGIYELLWPALHYIPSNGMTELNKAYELFIPASNLWKAHNHTPFSDHYFKFLELVVTSTIKLFEAHRQTESAVNKIIELINSQGLEQKLKELLKTYHQ